MPNESKRCSLFVADVLPDVSNEATDRCERSDVWTNLVALNISVIFTVTGPSGASLTSIAYAASGDTVYTVEKEVVDGSASATFTGGGAGTYTPLVWAAASTWAPAAVARWLRKSLAITARTLSYSCELGCACTLYGIRVPIESPLPSCVCVYGITCV